MRKVFFLIMVLSATCVFSQTGKDVSALKDLFKSPPHSIHTEYIKKSSNELEFTAAVLFLGYKELFSSQDQQSCVFYPSCSVYAIECLREDHFPKSVFKVFDRLTRCHPLATPQHYEIHQSGQLYDPVHN